MKISYTGFAGHISKDLPTGCQGIKFGMKRFCKENEIEFDSFLKNPDIILFEMNSIGNLSFNKENVVKTLDVISSSKKIYILADDNKQLRIAVPQYLRYASGNKLKLLDNFPQEYKDKFYSFMRKIKNKEFNFILPCYEVPSINVPCRNLYNFDYSHFHRYQNCYIQGNRKKILSYSWKKTQCLRNKDFIYLSNRRELECFQMLCENRVCYMEDYKKIEAPISWIRNRYAQSFNANALVVGLKHSYFGDEYNISLNDYYNMNDDEFENAVKLQKQKFLTNTSSLEKESAKLKVIFNESL